MPTFYFAPKHFSGGNGSGSNASNPIKGFAALNAAMVGGTIQAGDLCIAVGTQGPFTVSELADFPNTSRATKSQRFDFIDLAGGILLGSSQGLTSSLSGRTLDFQDVLIDMSGQGNLDTDQATRMVAVIRFRGEDYTVKNIRTKSGNYNYLFGGATSTAGSVRIAGTAGADAEARSLENIGIVMLGNGWTLDTAKTDGNNAFSQYGIVFGPSGSTQSGASNGKTCTARNFEMWGSAHGFHCQPYGTGVAYQVKPGTKLVLENGYAHDPCWGRTPDMAIAPYNAQAHGNGGGVQGVWQGRALIKDFHATGGFQDGLAVGSAVGTVVKYPNIHDIGVEDYQYWSWNATSLLWQLTTVANNAEGNGVKMGLGNRDGVSPSTWLGSDGTPGGEINVDELRNILIGGQIQRVKAFGVSANGGRGGVIHGTEIYDTGNTSIALFVSSAFRGQWMVSNCFVRKLTSDPGNFCLNVQANIAAEVYNCIFWSNPAVSTQRDVQMTAGTVTRKGGNLLVTGRVNGNWSSVPGGADLPVQVPNWTIGSGLSSTDPLRGLGVRDAITRLRTHGVNKNGQGNYWPRKNGLIAVPPGCY